MKVHPAVAKYMAKIGAKGGSTTGPTKVRGGSEYYKQLAAQRKKAKRLAVVK